MTEQQLQKIEQQWLKSDCDDLSLAVTHVFALCAEVRRLNRMVDKAVEMLHAEIDCPLDKNGIRKYLESEVADNG